MLLLLSSPLLLLFCWSCCCCCCWWVKSQYLPLVATLRNLYNWRISEYLFFKGKNGTWDHADTCHRIFWHPQDTALLLNVQWTPSEGFLAFCTNLTLGCARSDDASDSCKTVSWRLVVIADKGLCIHAHIYNTVNVSFTEITSTNYMYISQILFTTL